LALAQVGRSPLGGLWLAADTGRPSARPCNLIQTSAAARHAIRCMGARALVLVWLGEVILPLVWWPWFMFLAALTAATNCTGWG
jgi:hypothetical protein